MLVRFSPIIHVAKAAVALGIRTVSDAALEVDLEAVVLGTTLCRCGRESSVLL